MKTTIKQCRQGDVLLERTRSPKVCEELVPDSNGRAILAEGEATGHHHSVSASDAIIISKGAERFLRVTNRTVLSHEEHAQIALSRGTYEITIQREEWDDEIRNVLD